MWLGGLLIEEIAKKSFHFYCDSACTGLPKIPIRKGGETMTEFPNALLTSRQVARILKVNINRVGEYAAAGRLPFVYTPPTSDKKFRVSDVNKFIASLTDD